MNAIEYALTYRKRGWFPIPIPTRSKIPPLEGWQLLRLAEAEIPKYFAGAMNIGVLTGAVSKNLVDIDLDSQSAIRLAPRFLPSTIMFGRQSKPLSHWVYTAYGARTEIFATPSRLWGQREQNGQKIQACTLLELRADGKQTVFPQGIHECGETIGWASDLNQPPLDLSSENLRTAVAKLASTCLLIHFGWNDEDACAFSAHPNPTAISTLAPEVQGLVTRWLGPAAAPRVAVQKPKAPTVEGSFEIAVVRWNAEHTLHFDKRNSGPCPVCNDSKSFGQLRDNPERWSCFSTDHPDDVGIRSPNQDCYIGDALDLEAFKRNKTRAVVLREDGFLQQLKVVHTPQATPQATPQPTAPPQARGPQPEPADAPPHERYG